MFTLQIVDIKTRQEVGSNTIGELFVRSETSMICYHHDKEKTEAVKDPKGWINTGRFNLFRDTTINVLIM